MKKIFILTTLFLSILFFAQKNLPNVNLKNLEGKSMSTTNDFSEKDKLYIFSFWATWCAPCLEELDAINEVYDDWKKDLNLELVAVSVDDSRTNKRVKPLVNGKGWSYTILQDINQEMKRKIGFATVPYIIIVKNGKILYTENGHTPGSEKTLFEKLKTL